MKVSSNQILGNSHTFLKLCLQSPINNTREVSLHFSCEDSAILHGFGGYFECILYGDVTLSNFKQYTIFSMPGQEQRLIANATRYMIPLFFLSPREFGTCRSLIFSYLIKGTNPMTHTPEMSSWFPIFFPLRV